MTKNIGIYGAKIKATTLIAGIVFAPSVSIAQIRLGSLPEVLAYADEYSRELQIYNLNERQSASVEKQSQAFLLPAVTGSSIFNNNITLQPTLVPSRLFTQSAPADSFEELIFGKQYLYGAGAQVSWDILNLQKWFAAKIAGIQYTIAQAETAQRRFDIHTELARNYYSLLLSREYELVLNQNLDVLTSIRRSAENKYSQGIIGEDLRNLAIIQQLKIEKELLETHFMTRSLCSTLKTQLNISDSLVLTERLASDTIALPDFSFSKLAPELTLRTLQLKLSRAHLAQARGTRYPTITVLYQYNRNWATDRFADFSTASNLPQQFLGLRFSIPVFSGFAIREQIRQSAFMIRNQQLQLEIARDNVFENDRMLKDEYILNYTQWMKSREVLELSEKNDGHIQNRYEKGLIGLDERLSKLQDLCDAQQDYLKSLSDLANVKYRILVRQINF